MFSIRTITKTRPQRHANTIHLFLQTEAPSTAQHSLNTYSIPTALTLRPLDFLFLLPSKTRSAPLFHSRPSPPVTGSPCRSSASHSRVLLPPSVLPGAATQHREKKVLVLSATSSKRSCLGSLVSQSWLGLVAEGCFLSDLLYFHLPSLIYQLLGNFTTSETLHALWAVDRSRILMLWLLDWISGSHVGFRIFYFTFTAVAASAGSHLASPGRGCEGLFLPNEVLQEALWHLGLPFSRLAASPAAT